MRIVNTYEYVSMLKELVENGDEVSVKISGQSMQPFLKPDRDIAFFKAPGRELRVGDIVFYQRNNGQFILHRICKIDCSGFYLIGDGQRAVEGPLERRQIFALVTAVQRDGKMLRPGNPTWEFFARVWIRLPLRQKLLKLYGLLK